MKETNHKIKAGVFAVTMLFLFMSTAPTINAQLNGNLFPIKGLMTQPIMNPQTVPNGNPTVPQQHTYLMSPLFPGAKMIIGAPSDPSNDDEPFLPSSGRCSFMFLTAVRAEYNGSEKIIGVQFNIYMNSRNEVHTSCWEPANVCISLEGDHAGTYYYPAWFWEETFSIATPMLEESVCNRRRLLSLNA